MRKQQFLNINFSIFHYLKGIKYCLSDANSRQRDVSNFKNICKKYHDQDECLKQEFFNYLKLNKGIFLTGPLTNMFFELKTLIKFCIHDLTGSNWVTFCTKERK